MTISKYNIENLGAGSGGKSNSTCKKGSAPATGTTCSVYMVNTVSVNGTALSGWTPTLSIGTATGATSVYGKSASVLVTVPSGLSSTSSTAPDLVQIAFTKDTTHSYVPNSSGNPGGTGYSCVLTAGTYVYTAFSCSP